MAIGIQGDGYLTSTMRWYGNLLGADLDLSMAFPLMIDCVNDNRRWRL